MSRLHSTCVFVRAAALALAVMCAVHGVLGGHPKPKDCTRGQYLGSNYKGEGACKACPTATYQDAVKHRSHVCLNQTHCGRGQRIIFPNAPASTPPELTTRGVCAPCSKAYEYMNETSHLDTACMRQPVCSYGQFIRYQEPNRSFALAACTVCPTGRYVDVQYHRRLSCTSQPSCPAGRFAPPNNVTAKVECSECTGATYQDAVSHRMSSCTQQPLLFCGAGQQYLPGDSKTANKCGPCPTHHYQERARHQTITCLVQPACGLGEFLNVGASAVAGRSGACDPCPNQQYKDVPHHRSTECTDQPWCSTREYYVLSNQGNSSTQPGACAPCLPGHYQNTTRHRYTQCRAPPPGGISIVIDVVPSNKSPFGPINNPDAVVPGGNGTQGTGVNSTTVNATLPPALPPTAPDGDMENESGAKGSSTLIAVLAAMTAATVVMFFVVVVLRRHVERRRRHAAAARDKEDADKIPMDVVGRSASQRAAKNSRGALALGLAGMLSAPPSADESADTDMCTGTHTSTDTFDYMAVSDDSPATTISTTPSSVSSTDTDGYSNIKDRLKGSVSTTASGAHSDTTMYARIEEGRAAAAWRAANTSSLGASCKTSINAVAANTSVSADHRPEHVAHQRNRVSATFAGLEAYLSGDSGDPESPITGVPSPTYAEINMLNGSVMNDNEDAYAGYAANSAFPSSDWPLDAAGLTASTLPSRGNAVTVRSPKRPKALPVYHEALPQREQGVVEDGASAARTPPLPLQHFTGVAVNPYADQKFDDQIDQQNTFVPERKLQNQGEAANQGAVRAARAPVTSGTVVYNKAPPTSTKNPPVYGAVPAYSPAKLARKAIYSVVDKSRPNTTRNSGARESDALAPRGGERSVQVTGTQNHVYQDAFAVRAAPTQDGTAKLTYVKDLDLLDSNFFPPPAQMEGVAYATIDNLHQLTYLPRASLNLEDSDFFPPPPLPAGVSYTAIDNPDQMTYANHLDLADPAFYPPPPPAQVSHMAYGECVVLFDCCGRYGECVVLFDCCGRYAPFGVRKV